LAKKGGKRFRRSLKTKDQKLAERRIKEIKRPKLTQSKIVVPTPGQFKELIAAVRFSDGRADVPSISRWLGHSDGGALAMRVYGHLREEHSDLMIQRVNVDDAAPSNVVPLSSGSQAESAGR